MNLCLFLQLIRFDKPIGTLLLWCPTAWSLWLANQRQPPIFLISLLFLGTFLMRSAGCIFNDITDRHIDQHVQRTAFRPITSGKVSLMSAFTVLIMLLMAACAVLIQLPPECFKYALFALLITGVYPFAKRFLAAPQFILGLAFSMGIPIAYAASGKSPDSITGLLLLINFFWILAYDTAYAMNDREDDKRIGVHSTALLFGKHVSIAILLCSVISHSLWLGIAALNHLPQWFYWFWGIGAIIIFSQAFYKNTQKLFESHAIYGLLMWIALMP